MKLNQYKEKKNHKKIIAIALVIIGLIGGIILEKTFASFKENKSFKVMEGNFIYEGKGDIIFAFYNTFKNQSLTKMPKKNEGYVYVKGECDKGASVEWNEEKWAPLVLNLDETKTTCSLYFERYSDSICDTTGENSGACYLARKADINTTDYAYDGKKFLNENGTDDNNLRFIGESPNNYVVFNDDYIWLGYDVNLQYTNYFNSYEECQASYYKYNCQKIRPAWQIIGVMNNVEDESGNIRSHIKLIRASIGEYSWDSSASNINNGYGVNEWSTSDIAKVLNENYYNKEAGGTCYNSYKNTVRECPKWEFIGLDSDARSMISKIKWHTGTMPVHYESQSELITPSYMYEVERSENNGKICIKDNSYCKDEENRTTIWTGYIGLSYLSDYGYATGGYKDSYWGDKTKEQCLNSAISTKDCFMRTWIYENYYGKNKSRWTITPSPSSGNTSSADNTAAEVFIMRYIENNMYGGKELSADAYSALSVNPVVYLKSNIKIEEDNSENYGSKDNPFRLTMD